MQTLLCRLVTLKVQEQNTCVPLRSGPSSCPHAGLGGWFHIIGLLLPDHTAQLTSANSR